MAGKVSETITENIFRDFYGAGVFLEKSAIPNAYGFKSKRKTENIGFPDFFLDSADYAIIVEAKAVAHSQAEDDVKFYINENNIQHKDIIGIAISGQHINQIKATYFYKLSTSEKIETFLTRDVLLSLEDLKDKFLKHKYGETISDEELTTILKSLNETFHEGNIRDTDRSLFFSGIMIALTNNNFRNTYRNISAPTAQEVATVNAVVLEAHNLNNAIVNSITVQLASKINNLSKEFSWKDKFSFIKNVDFSLIEYKNIIIKIEEKIYLPFTLDEKQDLLGKAYKIFLSRSGKIDNKNIILTPDHIKELMVKLARLSLDDVVIDTCMGTGGFLMESMEKLVNLAKGDTTKIENIKENQLIGFEIDSVLFALACSNMFLHGDGRTNLLFRSSLLNTGNDTMINSTDSDLLDYIKSKKPTKAIINPPYERNASIDFVNQALDYLEPNGKLIIIMPTPTLTKNQSEGGKTHEVLKKAKLDFIIKMPDKLFTEQKRTVNTSIFGFTKTPHDKNDMVLFYDLEDDGFVSIQHKGRVDIDNRWNDIENNILTTINNSLEIPGVSEKRKIYKGDELVSQGVQNIRDSKHKLVKLGELFNTEKGSLQSSKANEDGEYNFITASSEWLKHDEYTHDTEALIFAVAASGSLGRTHYVNDKFVASNLCLILTPKNAETYPINLEFYNVYFEAIRKKLVRDLADGTSKLTINEAVLNDYYIEYIPIDIQNQYVRDFVDQYKKVEEQLLRAHEQLKNGITQIL